VYQRSVNSSGENSGAVTLSYYVPYPTSTQAAPSPASATVGETITLTATVTSSGGDCPGTVQFEVDGAPVGNPVTVKEGKAQTATTAPAAGNHPIIATYSGTLSSATQAGCLPSTSTPSTLSVLYPTTTHATPNPSSANVGETITITATVTAPTGVNCPGTVQFELDGKPAGGPVTVHEGGAQTTIIAPAAGNHPITATYSGAPSTVAQAGCQVSTSAPSTLSVLYPTTTQAAPNPSSASVGETITITATVTAPTGVSCPGTVQFELDGKPIGSPVTVQNATAQTTATAPSAGNHPITATYSGTPSTETQAGCLPSTSTPSTLSVLYPTTTHATPNPTSANVGETITITATVVSSPGVVCPGSVQFAVDGKPIGEPVAVDQGTAHTTITAPPAGEHPVTAVYSGSSSTAAQAGCLPSTSAPSTLTVNGPPVTITPLSKAEALVAKPTACESFRHFAIHLLLPRQDKLLSAQVYVDHKLVKTLTGATRRYYLNLQGRPYQTITVTLNATQANGKHITGNRVYHTCRLHKLPGHTKFNI
jgi:hypothetical protein